ncbi:MAG: hypothetical protein EOP37_03040 [Rubrivivax sp.]|nr:MAG: hypothetical protein EOP37_03040 [Rubrivivax sp.]
MGEMGLSARTASRGACVVEHLAHLSGRSEGMSPSTSEPVVSHIDRGSDMASFQQARIDESDKPLRARHPLAGCDQQTLIDLQRNWGMTETQVFGPRLGSDAICLRADLTMGSALANLRELLVSSASMLSLLADNSAHDDPTRHVVNAVKESLRESLGMLGVVERAID